MRCLATLLLLAVPALCWATDTDETDEDQASRRGACVQACPADAAPAQDAPQARRATPAVGGGAPKPTRGGGGGDVESTVVPRGRSPHWHSFLPGMFR